MSQMTNFLASSLFSHVLRNSAYASPTTVFIGLFTAAPGKAGGGTEVTGGSYARQSVVFAAPTNGVGANSGLIAFPTASANWGTITHWAVFDAVSAGNMLLFGPLSQSRVVNNTEIFRFPISNISITFT